VKSKLKNEKSKKSSYLSFLTFDFLILTSFSAVKDVLILRKKISDPKPGIKGIKNTQE